MANKLKLNNAQRRKLELMILNGLPRFKSIAYEAGIKEMESQEDVIQECALYMINRILRAGKKSLKSNKILSPINISKAGTYLSNCVHCRSKNKLLKQRRENTLNLMDWYDIKVKTKF